MGSGSMLCYERMHRPHIITLSGKPGSGKSTTADKVAELLGYSRYSAGDLVRKIIKKHHMTLADFNNRAASDHSIDDEIDEELRKLRNDKDLVVDSRLGFYWIPESFKVYLNLNIDVATARIYKDAKSNAKRSAGAGRAGSIAEVQNQVRSRLQNEQQRFKAIYGVDPYDTKHFDLVIDTSRHSPQTVALTIFDTYKRWLKSDEWTRVEEKVPLGYSFKNQY